MINILAWTLIVVGLLALWHFFYENAIAPSVRWSLRNRLFVLRDDIRNLKIEGLKKDDEEAFWMVHDGINHMLTRLPTLTIERLADVKRELEHDPKLKEIIDHRRDIVKRCSNAEIRSIYDKTSDVIMKAMLVNSFGWIVYLVPIIGLMLAWKLITTLADEIVVIPARLFNDILPKSPELNHGGAY